MSSSNADRRVLSVDLFCGAGGFSEGLRQACEELGYDLVHAGINHDAEAIDSHAANHPDAEQYHSKVMQETPAGVIDDLVDEEVRDVHQSDVEVDLLTAGPECTHFSRARGGKPVKNQRRMSAWNVLTWVQKLSPESFIIENVSEIKSWGSPDEDGQPSRDGEVFDAWVNAMNTLGYAVDWTVLNAADFGDPTSRERFFLIGTKTGKPTFPDPTHSDTDDDKPDRRTAAEIIDWSDNGTSIWTRDVTEPRIHSPPKNNTLQRIAEGLRQHCGSALEPFADAIADMGRDDIRELRDNGAVPYRFAQLYSSVADKPFLVAPPRQPSPAGDRQTLLDQTILLRQQDGGSPIDVKERSIPTIAKRGGHSLATVEVEPLIKPKNGPNRGIHSNPLYKATDRPLNTITTDPRAKLVAPSLIRMSHGGAALSLNDPMPTIATERGGVFSVSSPYLCPLNNPRKGQRPRTRAVGRPLMTVPASKSPAAIALPEVQPFIEDCQGPAKSITEPLPTQPGSDRYFLCVPEMGTFGLDIKYRMLQPNELKQAQGFDESYKLIGTKSDQTTQIGNAVPVNLAKNLCKHVLMDESAPSLASYGGGMSGDSGTDIPAFQDVVSDD